MAIGSVGFNAPAQQAAPSRSGRKGGGALGKTIGGAIGGVAGAITGGLAGVAATTPTGFIAAPVAGAAGGAAGFAGGYAAGGHLGEAIGEGISKSKAPQEAIYRRVQTLDTKPLQSDLTAQFKDSLLALHEVPELQQQYGGQLVNAYLQSAAKGRA